MQLVDDSGIDLLTLLENDHLTLGHHRQVATHIHHISRLALGRVEHALAEVFVLLGYYLEELSHEGIDIIAFLAVEQIHGRQLPRCYVAAQALE